MTAFKSLVTIAQLLLVAVLVGCGAPAPEEEDVAQLEQELCHAARLSSDAPGDHATAGTLVTWTARARCRFPHPQYAFWVQGVNGRWTLAQPFAARNTYPWRTAGLPEGTYTWWVWARDGHPRASHPVAIGRRTFTIDRAPGCSSVTSTAAPQSPNSIGQLVEITTTASCRGLAAEIEVRHAPPGGAWEIVQPYSAETRFEWNTTGAAAGTHSFQVFARVQGSTIEQEAATTFEYVLESPCTSVSMSIDPAGTALVGTPVELTATATCGGDPEYQFWIAPYPSGTQAILRPWDSSPTLVWDSSGFGAGRYFLSVAVRNQGGPPEQELRAGSSFDLATPAPCADATLSATPQGLVALIGTPVELSAATSCESATYEFWMQPPGGVSQVVRTWNVSPSFAWDTESAVAGRYLFEVRVRQSGATDEYQARAFLTYDLGAAADLCGNGMLDAGETCDGVNLAGATCASVSGGEKPAGDLHCTPVCSFDTTWCIAPPPLPSCLRASYSVPYTLSRCTQRRENGNADCTTEPPICSPYNGTANIVLGSDASGSLQTTISGISAARTYPLLRSGSYFTSGSPNPGPFSGTSWVQFRVNCDTSTAVIEFGDPETRLGICIYGLSTYFFAQIP